MRAASIDTVIEEIRAGRMVVIVDDEDRENEGDLVMAAAKATPEAINFMTKFGRGLICLTLTRERCQRLDLPLMVASTDARHTTNFTVSIEARAGVTTGISAQDRARTVRAACAPDAGPGDITRPGHVFPVMAQPGGVLTRAGHTEAGCDLARLAGCEPAAVIVEILNDDGSMARRPDLDRFAAAHNLKIGAIEDLVRHRVKHERTVHRRARFPLDTAHGRFELFTYDDAVHKTTHLALAHGRIAADKPTLVRVHLENTLDDTLGFLDDRRRWPVADAVARIASEDAGVVVILRLPAGRDDLDQRLRQRFQARADESDSQMPTEWRTLGAGGQILSDLGVGRMRLMNAPLRYHGLGGFGLSIDEYLEA